MRGLVRSASIFFAVLTGLMVTGQYTGSTATRLNSGDKQESAKQAVQHFLDRLLPKQAGCYVFEVIPVAKDYDDFEIEKGIGKNILCGYNLVSLY